MRRELFALLAGALGVSLLAAPALVHAQESAATVTVNPPTAQQTPPPTQPTVIVAQTPPKEEKVVIVSSPQEAANESTTTTEMRTGVIATGVITFGISYGVAAFAGSQSDRSSDKRMYVPLLGPWLALADRDDCPVAQQSCDSETTDKVLMAVDGVFQAAGVLTAVWGVLSPRTISHHSSVASRDVHLVPVSMGHGSSPGIFVVGTF